jgi:hypothetical protein
VDLTIEDIKDKEKIREHGDNPQGKRFLGPKQNLTVRCSSSTRRVEPSGDATIVLSAADRELGDEADMIGLDGKPVEVQNMAFILVVKTADPSSHLPAIGRLDAYPQTSTLPPALGESCFPFSASAHPCLARRRVRCLEPVLARRPGFFYRSWRAVQRSRGLALSIAGLILALGGGLVTSLHFLARGRTLLGKLEASLAHVRALGLAGASIDRPRQDQMLALLLAREAVRLEASAESIAQLRMALADTRERWAFTLPATAKFAIPSTDGKRIAFACTGPTAGFLELEGCRMTLLEALDEEVTPAAYSRDGFDHLLGLAGAGSSQVLRTIWQRRMVSRRRPDQLSRAARHRRSVQPHARTGAPSWPRSRTCSSRRG